MEEDRDWDDNLAATAASLSTLGIAFAVGVGLLVVGTLVIIYVPKGR